MRLMRLMPSLACLACLANLASLSLHPARQMDCQSPLLMRIGSLSRTVLARFIPSRHPAKPPNLRKPVTCSPMRHVPFGKDCGATPLSEVYSVPHLQYGGLTSIPIAAKRREYVGCTAQWVFIL